MLIKRCKARYDAKDRGEAWDPAARTLLEAAKAASATLTAISKASDENMFEYRAIETLLGTIEYDEENMVRYKAILKPMKGNADRYNAALAAIIATKDEDMAGRRVLPALKSAEASGATIYWGCVTMRGVTNKDRFPLILEDPLDGEGV